MKNRQKNEIKISLVVGVECNRSCPYCYMREITGNSIYTKNVPESQMHLDWIAKYIKNLKEQGYSVDFTFFGGEPLLYFKTIQKMTELLEPLKIPQIRITSNGTLLTQEIVDFVNKHNIIFCISTDGEDSERVRGYDILKDKNTVRLLNQIQCLITSSVLYSGNEDCYKVVRYINKYLKNVKGYAVFPVKTYGDTEYLSEDFNFELYHISYVRAVQAYRDKITSLNCGQGKGLSVLPDGNIVDFYSNQVVGKIDSNGVRTDYPIIHTKSKCLFEKCEFFKTPYCNKLIYQQGENEFCQKVAKENRSIYEEVKRYLS